MAPIHSLGYLEITIQTAKDCLSLWCGCAYVYPLTLPIIIKNELPTKVGVKRHYANHITWRLY